MDSKRRVSVAVIGSGLAGLTAAYLLTSKDAHPGVVFDVHLFEKSPTLGMDTHSISVPTGDSGEKRIDVPMRSFQGGYYKQLIALYKRLGVDFRRSDFSYSFSSLTEGIPKRLGLRTYLIYNGYSGIKGLSPPANDPYGQSVEGFICKVTAYFSFAVAVFVILIAYLRLLFLSSPLFRPGPSVTFQEWVSETTPTSLLARWTRLDASWRVFSQEVLVPLFSAVCTASEEDVYSHPVAEFLEYIWLTIGHHHYVVQHGVQDVVLRLTRNISQIHLSCSIVSIQTDPSDSSKLVIQTSEGTYPGFSHLIVATQANSSIPLLTSYLTSLPQDASGQDKAIEELLRCLRSFQYRRNVVVNHTDEAFLPPDTRDRRDLNLVSGSKQSSNGKHTDPLTLPTTYTMATHALLRSGSNTAIFQTTNPIASPRKETILSVASLERAVLTAESKAALQQLSVRDEGWWPFIVPSTSLGRLQGAGRLGSPKVPGIWVCGSYAYSGIPLLEGCVASARDVVEQGVLRCEAIPVLDAPW